MQANVFLLCRWSHFYFLTRHRRDSAFALLWLGMPFLLIMWERSQLQYYSNISLPESPRQPLKTTPQWSCHRCGLLARVPPPRGNHQLCPQAPHSAYHILDIASAWFFFLGGGCVFQAVLLPGPCLLRSDCSGNPHLRGSPFLGLQRQARGPQLGWLNCSNVSNSLLPVPEWAGDTCYFHFIDEKTELEGVKYLVPRKKGEGSGSREPAARGSLSSGKACSGPSKLGA